MTVPGVGPVVALALTSRYPGPLPQLEGRRSCFGIDAGAQGNLERASASAAFPLWGCDMRTLLYEAAQVMLAGVKRWSWLKLGRRTSLSEAVCARLSLPRPDGWASSRVECGAMGRSSAGPVLLRYLAFELDAVTGVLCHGLSLRNPEGGSIQTSRSAPPGAHSNRRPILHADSHPQAGAGCKARRVRNRPANSLILSCVARRGIASHLHRCVPWQRALDVAANNANPNDADGLARLAEAGFFPRCALKASTVWRPAGAPRAEVPACRSVRPSG